MTVTRLWVSPAFWFICYVNEVSYLVGKPFIPLSSLSEKLCWSVLEISEDAHLFSVVENSILFSYAARFARSVLMCGCILQMSENRHKKKRAEFRGWRFCQSESVTDQRSQKIRSQRQASTPLHWSVPNSLKAWRSGLSAQSAREFVCCA